MIKDVIATLMEGRSLSQKQSYAVMKEIMTGEATPSQIAGFLVALRNKGETAEEIAGCALAMRDAAQPLAIRPGFIVDNCGTGGDDQCGLNISTAASFVIAGAGYTVAKHGNRSVSSKCGSADVLEMMGVKIDAPVAVVEHSLNEAGIGFLFAPQFHPAMKHAMPTRRELGIRTVFNILGPLTNPAKAHVQLIGVYKKDMTRLIAQVMAKTGQKAGIVVHSGGWDEITLHGKTEASEMIGGKVKSYRLAARDFGLPAVPAKNLKGGDAKANADSILRVLEGDKKPVRFVIVANAAALIWVAERARGKKNMKLKEAVAIALRSLESGEALNKFRQMAEMSHAFN